MPFLPFFTLLARAERAALRARCSAAGAGIGARSTLTVRALVCMGDRYLLWRTDRVRSLSWGIDTAIDIQPTGCSDKFNGLRIGRLRTGPVVGPRGCAKPFRAMLRCTPLSGR